MSETVIEASYKTSPVLDYCGNPLIEAMPSILAEEEAAERLMFFPPMPEHERHLPKEIRLHCINRLMHLVQPLPIHLELEASISSAIRGGYVSRNPMESSTWHHLYGVAGQNFSKTMFNSTGSTLSLVGLSGMGKTTALKSVLRLYPQVIKHTRYGDREFFHTQIVWLKLECPFDGSLRGLCQEFFHAVDTALGYKAYEEYYSFNNRTTIGNLINGMRTVASTFFVGALFIDELQHLKLAKAGGKDNMLNFFVNLVNNIGIPVIFVGTNSMVGLLSDVLRNARRATGLGILDFKNPEQRDPAWEIMLKAMWQYQWIKHPAPLSENLEQLIYDLTQGVTDFLGKLMILGQRYAIQSGLETLDERVFRHVATTKMKLLLPAIAALRSGSLKKMAKFEDLLPTDEQLEEMMKEDITIGSDRVAVLRRQQDALCVDGMTKLSLEMSAETSSKRVGALPNRGVELEVADPSDRQALQEAIQSPGQQTASLFAKLADQPDSLALLRAAQWILDDPFEFVPAYRVA